MAMEIYRKKHIGRLLALIHDSVYTYKSHEIYINISL